MSTETTTPETAQQPEALALALALALCGDRLPDLPDDRLCVRELGHDGDHNDGVFTWETHESTAVREEIQRVHTALVCDAPRVAREAVLNQLQVKARGVATEAPRGWRSLIGALKD